MTWVEMNFSSLQIATENLDRFFGRGSFSTEDASFDTLVWLAKQTFPWSLVLVWSLIRRIKGAREDWAGRLFLHAWWISIFVFFVFAARSAAGLFASHVSGYRAAGSPGDRRQNLQFCRTIRY